MANVSSIADCLLGFKRRGEKVAMLTAYDYPTARLLEEAGVDILLVGDSLGMVVLGFADTTEVTMEHMLHHTRAVARARKHIPVLADLPFASYETPGQAVANAQLLLQAGADAVKLEGGRSHLPQIEALAHAGIPVMAHIGMMPQSVRKEGGYRVKGKTPEQAADLLADAAAVEKAGSFGILLELVVPEVAAQVSAQCRVPTIGIGSGSNCDGQVLVTQDLAGMFPWFTPKFVKPRAALGETLRGVAEAYVVSTKQAPVHNSHLP
jgi:3-methyl-2-oxobutanoate hydroxymethyltransferase